MCCCCFKFGRKNRDHQTVQAPSLQVNPSPKDKSPNPVTQVALTNLNPLTPTNTPARELQGDRFTDVPLTPSSAIVSLAKAQDAELPPGIPVLPPASDLTPPEVVQKAEHSPNSPSVSPVRTPDADDLEYDEYDDLSSSMYASMQHEKTQ